MDSKYNVLFEQTAIGKVKIKNRFAMAPMGPLGLSDSEGGWNQRGIEYYTERARGGTGLIITGVTFSDCEVETQSMPNCPNSTYNPVHFIRTSKEMTERIHSYGSKIFLLMSGGFGRVTIPTNLGEFPPVAPSPIQHRWLDKTCRELTKPEIRSIVESFGKGAYNAKRAGFDGVEIHAVHEGYLIDQFAISFFNHRTDEYGGSLENRLRFAREVVEEIKSKCGSDFPVSLRYSPKSFIKDWRQGGLPGEKFEEKGRDLPEGLQAAKLLVSYGYDALDVDVGSYDSWYWSHPPMYQKKGLYIEFARAVKNAVNVPILCAGRMDDPNMSSNAVKSGACDIVSLGRPLLADAEYVNKLRAGKVKSIRPCLSCHEGCMGRIQEYSMINCAVNPQCARERDFKYEPILKKKRVVIAGGGPAGCECARVLAIRGHEPVLYEKGNRLGGNLIPGGVPDFKEDDVALAKWYEYMLDELNVPVHLNTELTSEMLREMDFDALVIATGSVPKMFSLGDSSSIYSAAQVLLGEKDSGDSVVIVGGGLVGCETALWLAEKGKSVTIVEALGEVLAVNAPLCHANSDMLKALLPYNGVKIMCGATVTDVQGKRVTVRNNDTGNKTKIEADSVVLCIGYSSKNHLYDEMFDVPELYKIGDAKDVANIHNAIWEAFEVANHI